MPKRKSKRFPRNQKTGSPPLRYEATDGVEESPTLYHVCGAEPLSAFLPRLVTGIAGFETVGSLAQLPSTVAHVLSSDNYLAAFVPSDGGYSD